MSKLSLPNDESQIDIKSWVKGRKLPWWERMRALIDGQNLRGKSKELHKDDTYSNIVILISLNDKTFCN